MSGIEQIKDCYEQAMKTLASQTRRIEALQAEVERKDEAIRNFVFIWESEYEADARPEETAFGKLKKALAPKTEGEIKRQEEGDE